ncbi:SDR family oxidoreductase [Prosthecobacter sp.]|uniref:SDR family oxidoreductase n=1 Tax=Prosthecobacter sp. TaxID=1965333 RepID=UPI002AB88C29|nr:SDR family oxidoreductase [Prosthecobacter sp.]MDZ4405812.1 SDR family oxidoreductase [Prosthecobacter sp.]
MKVLVTGGAGFIGSHIAQTLSRMGATVVVLDDFSTGDRQNLDWSNGNSALEVIQGDAGNESLLAQIVPGCDWVFHQAAVASVPQSVAHPLETNRQNMDATLKLLIAARDAGVKRFLFASSSAIYGDSSAASKHESHAPAPVTPYGLQKYASERYCQLFHQLYGLPTVALRYFNVFGPRQSFDSPYSGVIARFCTLMLRGETPVIFGDGGQSRDFIFIDNIVQANLLAAEAPAERVAGQVFNAGTGESITLNQLVADINDLTRQNLVARHEPARPGDIRHSQADISALRTALGCEPKVTWKDGLAQTLEFYRQ